jgi:hypothetical protein
MACTRGWFSHGERGREIAAVAAENRRKIENEQVAFLKDSAARRSALPFWPRADGEIAIDNERPARGERDRLRDPGINFDLGHSGSYFLPGKAVSLLLTGRDTPQQRQLIGILGPSEMGDHLEQKGSQRVSRQIVYPIRPLRAKMLREHRVRARAPGKMNPVVPGPFHALEPLDRGDALGNIVGKPVVMVKDRGTVFFQL